MAALQWLLLLLLGVTTALDDVSVVVTKEVFEERFQGHGYERWSDFVKAAGEQNNPGGEARLKAGFTLLFAAIATVTVGTIIVYVVNKEVALPYTPWLVILILLSYAASVFMYCVATYANPAQKVVTNLLFGLVPWSVSCASYLMALQLVDFFRRLPDLEPIATEAPEAAHQSSLAWLTGGRQGSAVQELQQFDGSNYDLRFGLLLAVLPSLVICIWLTRTYATGFTGVGTFFDVLALCLFVDVWRLVMHIAVLIAPVWTLHGERPEESDNRKIPGMCKLTFLLCLFWFVGLLLMKRHATGVGFTDPIKIHVLACLTSYLFFPVSLALAWHYNETLFKDVLNLQHKQLTVTWLCMVFAISACMLLTATVFNATEPNAIGIVVLVASIIYTASTFTESVPGCIAMMVVWTAMTSFLVFLSVHYAEEVRDAIG